MAEREFMFVMQIGALSVMGHKESDLALFGIHLKADTIGSSHTLMTIPHEFT